MIDYVLVYNKNDTKNTEQRKIFLHNIWVNGLEFEIKVNRFCVQAIKCQVYLDISQLKSKKEDNLRFVLIHTPFETCLEVAEKVGFKMPIELNDLDEDLSLDARLTFRNCFKWGRYRELATAEKRKYFLAPYTEKLREKQFLTDTRFVRFYQ